LAAVSGFTEHLLTALEKEEYTKAATDMLHRNGQAPANFGPKRIFHKAVSASLKQTVYVTGLTISLSTLRRDLQLGYLP
jgi:hypothetical protein